METTYSYEAALAKSLEYFGGDDLPAGAYLDKYAIRNKENALLEQTPDEMHDRLAREFYRVEKKKFKKPLSYETIRGLIGNFSKIIPQGSPMFGIGNVYQYGTLSNCYALESPGDSYGGILRTDQQLVQIAKRRGGNGIDLSNLRPAGAVTQNAARTSTGVVSFAERYSNSTREVGQAGRRGALMLTLSVHHPEVLEFAESKLDNKKITGANISIRLSNEFLRAVEADEEYEQRWPVDSKTPIISRYVSARSVWKRLIHCAWQRAEPGLLFWDRILEESPADCYADFGYITIVTNPCGELPLSALDSCRLLLLNSFSFVKKPFTREAYFDFSEFYNTSQIAQRLMDDIIDLELEAIQRIIDKVKSDPEPAHVKRDELELWEKIYQNCENGRRTGTGITALGDAIAAVGLRYGSEESIQFTDKVYQTLKFGSYRASVDMAKELGPFPIWNHELEKNNPFLLRIKNENVSFDNITIHGETLWNDMKKYGRRNIANLTTPPAGTTSLVAAVEPLLSIYGTSSGIEPAFKISYDRMRKINPSDKHAKVDFVDENGDKWQRYQVYHPAVKLWMKITGKKNVEESPWHGCCANDINWVNRVKLQATAQKHVDHSISSTINLPENVIEEEVAKIYEAGWKAGCKGITVYRENCRTGVLVESNKLVKKSGIIKVDAPKRPNNLLCDIHHVKVKGVEYFVLVGLFDKKEPYEVFAGKAKTIEIASSDKVGILSKEKRGHYNLYDADKNLIFEDVGSHVEDEEATITRLVSTSMRHGVDIQFIVSQLEKTKGGLQSFGKALARVLKKYIPDSTPVKGEACPECQKDTLIREGGCQRCLNCPFSKCS